MNEKIEKKRNLILWLLSSVFFIIGLAALFYWFFIGQFYVYTEDAYVHGNPVLLTPQVSAGVVAIYADDTNLVEEGQIVVQLDRTDFEIDYHAKKAALGETVRQVAQLFEKVREKEAEVILRKAQLNQAELDLSHRISLNGTGAISLQEFEQAQTDVSVAHAALELSFRQLISAKLLVEGTTVQTHPLVKEASDQVRSIYLSLIRCQILAPARGYIAKRFVQVGDQVAVGQNLLSIVPLDYLWVEANYKETQLRNVRIGQPVAYTADLHGRNVKYHGRVIGFSAGTGNAFALLPPENASGNWIKIIQRVPVRISISLDELERYPLVIGLSMRVTVDIHDTSGPMLAQVPTDSPIYTTQLYDLQDIQLENVESIIDEIVISNLRTDFGQEVQFN